jgi:nucleotide-binding universal stress UspA family protein
LKTELINSARPVDYVILEYAEEQKKKIDLIVVGTKGTTGFKKLLLGSVASRERLSSLYRRVSSTIFL